MEAYAIKDIIRAQADNCTKSKFVPALPFFAKLMLNIISPRRANIILELAIGSASRTKGKK